jgi:hypothetical protein
MTRHRRTRTSTSSRLAPFAPLAAVDVPGAITELKLTLDWMRTDWRLRYSVTQVQTTHAYKALKKLGGVWP